MSKNQQQSKKREEPSQQVDGGGPRQMALIDEQTRVQLPSYIRNDSRRGNEDMGMEDVAIPRLEIVQALSPIRKENPEAVDGSLYNSVTGEVYGTSVTVLPVVFTKQFLVWKDRKQGGGFRGAFRTEDEAKNRIREIEDAGLDPRGSLSVSETPSHLCLLIRETGETEVIAIAMPRTKQKVSRKWNAQVQLAGGDRFGRMYLIGTTTEKNSQGQEYYNYSVSRRMFPSEAHYRAAESLYQSIRAKGGVTINHESVADGDDAAPTGSEV